MDSTLYTKQAPVSRNLQLPQRHPLQMEDNRPIAVMQAQLIQSIRQVKDMPFKSPEQLSPIVNRGNNVVQGKFWECSGNDNPQVTYIWHDENPEPFEYKFIWQTKKRDNVDRPVFERRRPVDTVPSETDIILPEFQELSNWSEDEKKKLSKAFQKNSNGLTRENWTVIAKKFDRITSRVIAAFCQLSNWDFAPINTITNASLNLNKNGNNFLPDIWVVVAEQMPSNDSQGTEAFCNITKWLPIKVVNLADTFKAAKSGNSALTWASIANIINDSFDNTVIFCQLQNWSYANLKKLAKAFKVNNNELDAKNWKTIAEQIGQGCCKEAIAICRLEGWNWEGINKLTTAFMTNANNLTAEVWLSVAQNMENNQFNNAIAFCQLDGWEGENIINLGISFKTNPNSLTAENWLSAASDLGNDRAADTITFCRLAQWDWANIDILIKGFISDNFALTGEQWVIIASKCNKNEVQHIINFLGQARTFVAKPEDVISFCSSIPNANIREMSDLLTSVAVLGTFEEITALFFSLGQVKKMKYAEIKDFLSIIGAQYPDTKIPSINELTSSLKKDDTIAALENLLVLTKGSDFQQIKPLLGTIRSYHNVSLDTICTLVTPVVTNCPAPYIRGLIQLLEVIKKNGSTDEITAMLYQAVKTLTAAHIFEITTFMKQASEYRTPKNIASFLEKLVPSAYARYQSVASKVSNFEKAPIPKLSTRDYNDKGDLIMDKTLPKYRCDDGCQVHFYHRHTYNHFEFAKAEYENSFWKLNTDINDELDDAVKKYATLEANINNEIGFLDPKGSPLIINHLCPLKTGITFDINLMKPEILSIKELNP